MPGLGDNVFSFITVQPLTATEVSELNKSVAQPPSIRLSYPKVHTVVLLRVMPLGTSSPFREGSPTNQMLLLDNQVKDWRDEL